MGKQKTILLGRRCGKLNFEGALRVFLTRVGGPKAMTDEKKLPWNNALSILRPALLNTPERVIKYLHGFVLVPEPEALRLHALDEKSKNLQKQVSSFTTGVGLNTYLRQMESLIERVGKFEKAARKALEVLHSGQEIKFEGNDHAAIPLDECFKAIDLLREAMGEDR